jgi:hypothetical protein
MKVELKVSIQPWSWETPPDPQEHVLELGLGESVNPDWLGEVGNPTIEVVSISEDQVLIKTNSLAPTINNQIEFSANTIDLESKINKNQTLILSTPTVDLGTKVEISLLDILS